MEEFGRCLTQIINSAQSGTVDFQPWRPLTIYMLPTFFYSHSKRRQQSIYGCTLMIETHTFLQICIMISFLFSQPETAIIIIVSSHPHTPYTFMLMIFYVPNCFFFLHLWLVSIPHYSCDISQQFIPWQFMCALVSIHSLNYYCVHLCNSQFAERNLRMQASMNIFRAPN